MRLHLSPVNVVEIYSHSARAGNAAPFMRLTLEAYRNIVKNVGSRADIATLCRVSKGFRHVAERALYNTLFLRNDEMSTALVHTLANSSSLAAYVDALTIFLSEDVDDSDSEDEEQELTERDTGDVSYTYWLSVRGALDQTIALRYLNIHIGNGFSTSVAWILRDCRFQLRRFHCDVDWDSDLITFLISQKLLEDLYILDYRDDSNLLISTTQPNTEASTPSLMPPSTSLPSLPCLTTLECTFSEAAIALVPERPITHLKTCFSRNELDSKRDEMYDLLAKLELSTCPLQSIDLADSNYTERFSSELLVAIVNTRRLMSDLRYLGTLVLPVHGGEVCGFFAFLSRSDLLCFLAPRVLWSTKALSQNSMHRI